MTAFGVSGAWMDQACLVGETMAARRGEEPVLDLGRRLAGQRGWELGAGRSPSVAPAIEVERFEEDPERWDGLS